MAVSGVSFTITPFYNFDINVTVLKFAIPLSCRYGRESIDRSIDRSGSALVVRAGVELVGAAVFIIRRLRRTIYS